MPFNMGPGEILLIFLLVVILFGAKRLPELARSMGRSIKEFKSATRELRDEFDMDNMDDAPRRASSANRDNKSGNPSESSK